MAEKEDKEQKELQTDTMLKVFVGELILKAWAWLGVISHPETEKILVNLKQAKLAIDAIEKLLELKNDFLSEDEIKETEIALSNLKLNYVSKLNEENKKTS